MNPSAKASVPVIRRLPKYYRYLRALKDAGVNSISSRELAAQMGTTASQVRQDFNCIGNVNGRQGIGYSVDKLLSILEGLLFGGGDHLPAILLGCGRLGTAVSSFIANNNNGFTLIAAFDVNPALMGQTISGIPIRPLDSLEDFCSQRHPQMAVLCLPRSGGRADQRPAGGAGASGGSGTFPTTICRCPSPDAVVENVHLGDSLMSLGLPSAQ